MEPELRASRVKAVMDRKAVGVRKKSAVKEVDYSRLSTGGFNNFMQKKKTK